MKKRINRAGQNSDLDILLKDVVSPKTYTKGSIIQGKVISVKPGEILVDIEGRAEGVISGRELKLKGKKLEKKVGDTVLAYVMKPENEEGQVELSIRRTGTALRWHELEQIRKEEKVIEVKVIEANTGGVIVEIEEGLRGFVPSSQLKNSRIYTDSTFFKKEDASKVVQSKLAELIDQKLEVKVMEIDKEKNKVILSEKYIFSDSDMAQRNQTLSNLKVGDELEGKVTGIAPFGLFVNASGLEGLVHLSEISWDKVVNPGDFYKIDDTVKVQVIGLSDNGKRVAYSIKRLIEDPWKNIVQNYKVGQVVEGEIKSIAQYGAFVKIENGLNGLIHISELSSKLVKDPTKLVKVGDKIKVKIISISNEDRHLGLSIKRVSTDKKEDKATSEPETGDSQMKDLDKLIAA